MAKSIIRKNFNKMSLSEQESYLVIKFQESAAMTQHISKLLAKVRGGNKVVLIDSEDRPDLIDMKSA